MRVALRNLTDLSALCARLRVVALFGPSVSAVREAGRTIARAAIGPSGNDLALTVVDTPELGRISEALSARPLVGGRAIVLVPSASEKLAKLVDDALDGRTEALLILGFGERFGKSGLASRIAASSWACLVDCAANRDDHGRALGAMLSAAYVSFEPAALAALIDWAEANDQDLENAGMLATLALGPGGHLSLHSLQALGVAPREDSAFSRAVTVALAGERRTIDRAVHEALDDGQTGVGLLRQALFSVAFARTGRGSWGARQGGSATHDVADAAATALWEAERLVKRSGTPQELVAGHAICAIAGLGKTGRL